MKLIFSENAWEDYLYWQKTDKKIHNRINKLVKEIKREPFEGVGKPEPLNTASRVTGLGESTKNTASFTRSRTTLCLLPNCGITTDLTLSFPSMWIGPRKITNQLFKQMLLG